MPNRVTHRYRRSLLGAAACAASLPLFVVAMQPASATIGDRGHDNPPPLQCAAGKTKWEATGTIDQQKAAYQLSTPGAHRNLLSGITFGPGIVRIDQLVAFDSYQGRENADAAAELNEQVRVEFYKGGVLQVASYATDDLEEGYATAWWRGPLGEVSLPDGADAVKIAHSSEFDGAGGLNAVTPSGVCFTYTPFGPAIDATVTHDCSSATVSAHNGGSAAADIVVTVNGKATTYPVPAGESVVHKLPLAEDTSYTITVAVGGNTVTTSTFAIDCVPATTPPPSTTPPTTVPPTTAPPTTVVKTTAPPSTPPTTITPSNTAAVQVLSAGSSAPAEQTAALAYTGRRSVFEAIGAGLLLLIGFQLVRTSRRRTAASR